MFLAGNFWHKAPILALLMRWRDRCPFISMTGFLAEDPRIASTPIVDAGFASVRKISEGTYATISDTSKGMTTMCNGGFLVGKDAALLIEGFVTANGAAFQLETLRKVTQVPAAGAVDSHYYFDHSCGNSYYEVEQYSVVGPHRGGKADYGRVLADADGG
jgi:hypothetical protein